MISKQPNNTVINLFRLFISATAEKRKLVNKSQSSQQRSEKLRARDNTLDERITMIMEGRVLMNSVNHSLK